MHYRDWLDVGYRLLPLVIALVAAAGLWLRRLRHTDETDIKSRIAARDRVPVIWAKRLDGVFNNDSVTLYNVLVEREGVRRIEVWRDGTEGLSRDH